MNIRQVIKDIHTDCFKLCKQVLGKYLPVAGNIGIFAQSDDEYQQLIIIKDNLTISSDNPDQKYFQLKEPLVIKAEGDLPEAAYAHLYIRKPDLTPYGRYKGDVDFVLGTTDYEKLKNQVLSNNNFPGAEIYDRPRWDTIQLTDPNINSVAYVGTKEFAEKVRVRFD